MNRRAIHHIDGGMSNSPDNRVEVDISENSTTSRDGFEVVSDNGEIIHFVPCSYESWRMRERVMLGLMRNMRDDYFVRDTRDQNE